MPVGVSLAHSCGSPGMFAILLGISTIVGQLNRSKKPILLAVFLLGALVFLGSLLPENEVRVGSGLPDQQAGVLGGPSAREEILSGGTLVAALSAEPAVAGMSQPEFSSTQPETLELLGMVQGQASPLGESLGRGSPITYKVAKGDTLSGIAQRFGVSVRTLIAANPGVKSRSLQVGQELVVLPTSGILYQSRAGDTLETIAAYFKVTPEQIVEFNRSLPVEGALLPGTTLVIPGVYLASSDGLYQNKSVLGYFVKPVEGWNFGVLHDRNAVDIASACGTPVVAAAEGLVLDVAASGWNGGYGHYVYMEHPNGTKTRYAHLEKTSVEIGDYLKQGEVLGTVGRTGHATGCHLHFEVEGAANPFAKTSF